MDKGWTKGTEQNVPSVTFPKREKWDRPRLISPLDKNVRTD